jgi:hypothetical protein
MLAERVKFLHFNVVMYINVTAEQSQKYSIPNYYDNIKIKIICY